MDKPHTLNKKLFELTRRFPTLWRRNVCTTCMQKVYTISTLFSKSVFMLLWGPVG